MKHKHTELMMEYAKDALETDKPWERWEIKRYGENFWDLFKCSRPTWIEHDDYRRKPRTININGFEVPEPYRGELKITGSYFTPYLSDPSDPFMKCDWGDDPEESELLSLGLIHLTKEAAILHAKALLSFTKGGDQ